MHLLHLNKILHCDLKSKNILTKDGEKIVKLCDFGLSIYKNKVEK